VRGRVLRFPVRGVSSQEGRALARRILDAPRAERAGIAKELGLEEPEALLSICAHLREEIDTLPASVLDGAEFFYRFLETPRRKIGLFDERVYFLGELALLAGTACRQLSRREEARLWFDRSESTFRHTANPAADLSRLAYQRLALRIEERDLDAVLELAPPLVESLQDLGMPDEALKCRFLEGLALMESDRMEESIGIFEQICQDARKLSNEKLLASGYANLTHLYGMRGDAEKAVEASRLAIPVLTRLDDRIALAKVQWGLARLVRELGQISAAIEAYRAAQGEFEKIGMRADVAALSLVVGDLLLETGQDDEARREILKALPVIEQLKMVPEGLAAHSLLRESLRHSKINRQALRDLHGYFEETQK
jgi:tetratricopeptide (TPR) repeat protein